MLSLCTIYSLIMIAEHDMMQHSIFCGNIDLRKIFHFIYKNNADLIFNQKHVLMRCECTISEGCLKTFQMKPHMLCCMFCQCYNRNNVYDVSV